MPFSFLGPGPQRNRIFADRFIRVPTLRLSQLSRYLCRGGPRSYLPRYSDRTAAPSQSNTSDRRGRTSGGSSSQIAFSSRSYSRACIRKTLPPVHPAPPRQPLDIEVVPSGQHLVEQHANLVDIAPAIDDWPRICSGDM